MEKPMSTDLEHRLDVLAGGLDLSDSDDRAIFRQRIGGLFVLMRFDVLRRMVDVPVATRSEAVRAIAQHYIARSAR